MGNLFVSEGLVKPYVVAIDSTLLKSKGHVWHASSMKKGIVPYSGIDTDARWGFSHTRGGYLDTNCTWYLVLILLDIVPLTADVTTANIPDNHVYPDLHHLTYPQPVTVSRNHKENTFHGGRPRL